MYDYRFLEESDQVSLMNRVSLFAMRGWRVVSHSTVYNAMLERKEYSVMIERKDEPR